jgi:hypothetical protein
MSKRRYASTLIAIAFILSFSSNALAMYAPGLGRFCSRDPIGFEGSEWNLYEYCTGAPFNKIDPFGLSGDSVTNYYKKCGEDFRTHKSIDKFCDCICNPADPRVGGRGNCRDACKTCMKRAIVEDPCLCMCREFGDPNDWRTPQKCRERCKDPSADCGKSYPFLPTCGSLRGGKKGEFIMPGSKPSGEIDADDCTGGIHHAYRNCDGKYYSILCCPCCQMSNAKEPQVKSKCRLGWTSW